MSITDSFGSVTGAVNSAASAGEQLVKNILGGKSSGDTPIGKAANKVELWPIKVKGDIEPVRKKLNPHGNPKIEKNYHKALEAGRFLESNIADAMCWLQQQKKDLMEKIQGYFDMNSLAVDGQLPDKPRAIKYIADSVKFLRQVNNFQQEIIGLIQAVTQNIGILQSMEQNMLGMIQANLNAIANLLHEICNWGLPDLPAIPNLFGDTIWHWNGFAFVPLAAFQPHVGFDFNFAFNQCVIHVPNVNIFRNYPTSIQTAGGLVYGVPPFIPPLGGIIPNTGINISDPQFIADMRNDTITPHYTQSFNPRYDMWGSVPNPATILSNYQMPADTYEQNIVGIVPDLRSDIVPQGAADYANPDVVSRGPQLRKDLTHFITLEAVVDSGYDPYITSAWLFYLNNARKGRAGKWLANFQTMYDQYLQPSVTSLQQNPVPWNNVLGGDGVQATPSIPLLTVVQKADAATLTTLLWKLSYIEASLLGYTRSKRWDAGADTTYVTSFTGSDLDYRATQITSTQTTTATLGTGTAEFPVDATFPTSISGALNTVIAKAARDIENNPAWRTSRTPFRYIFDQFAVAKEVDRFSQFWREFNGNLQALLVQDPYLVGFVTSYPDVLDSAINPLGSPTSYNLVRADVASRNRTWVPGTPLLTIPKAPLVFADAPTTGPNSTSNGWSGLNANPPTFDLDPQTFLSRPDIQALPIPTQIAMLRTNLSFAAVMKQRQRVIDGVQTAISTAQQFIQDSSALGFNVELTTPTYVPQGSGSVVAYDTTDFDMTGNVTSPTTFTVQGSGRFAVMGQLTWSDGEDTTRAVNLLVNGVSMYSTSTMSPSIQFSTNLVMQAGDVLSVMASHSSTNPQQLLNGFLSASLFSQDTTPEPIIPSGVDTNKTFTADVAFPILSAVRVTETSGVSPVDITTVTTSNGYTVYPYVDGVAVTQGVAGEQVQVVTGYGGWFQVAGAGFIPGGLLYVGSNGVLTQDFTAAVTGNQWLVCVGRAMDSDSFLFEPHIPQRTIPA